MAVDYCPFLGETNKFFGPSYICKKTEKEIMTGERLLKDYCQAGERHYTQCPHYAPLPQSSGCFLTSACVEAMGLEDDCPELTALRAFRDGWLSKQPGGREEVAEYYRIAPQVVDRIKTHSNAEQVFRKIYDEMVVPCVRLIHSGDCSGARALYREKTRELTEAYIQ